MSEVTPSTVEQLIKQTEALDDLVETHNNQIQYHILQILSNLRALYRDDLKNH